jgi:hypothetical protein
MTVRGKVNTFTHQITTQTSLLGLKTCTDGFDGQPKLLQRLRNTCDVVIHVRGNMELCDNDDDMRAISQK